MANDNNLTPFSPGQSGNPNGRPPIPVDVKEFQKTNNYEVGRILNECIFLPLEELKKRSLNKKNSALENLIVSVLLKAIKTGDVRTLNFFLDRLVGKVKEESEKPESGHRVIMDLLKKYRK